MDPDEIKSKILYALRFVTDPEIPISVVDLGLIRKLEVEDSKVHVKVVMTAPGCPYSAMIVQQVEESIRAAIPELQEVKVELEQFPPWTPFEMTEEGKERFKQLFGYDLVESFLRRYGSVENYYELVRRYYGIEEGKSEDK